MKIRVPNEILLPRIAEAVASGQSVRMRVRGNSMRPLLYDLRDEAVVSPFTNEDLVRGTIVLAYLPDTDRFVMHRIWSRDNSHLVLRGDGNVGLTEPCLISDVRGIVKQIFRNGKSVNLESFRWKLFQHVWMSLYPVRRYLLACIRIWREPACFFPMVKKFIQK